MQQVSYTVIRRNVKHARLKVHEDGNVFLYVPLDLSDEMISKIISIKSDWILSKKQYFQKKKTIKLQRNEILLYGHRYSYFYSSKYASKTIINYKSRIINSRKNLLDAIEQEKWLKTVARKYISARIDTLSQELSLPYNKLYVRSQESKWGNCSKEKNISINWRIIKAPIFVIDYVIIHELCHTIIMKHTKQFHTLLQSHYPHCEQAVAWLNDYGNNL